MITRYELWLDESGKFKEEAALKKKHLKPSFVGGILLNKKMVPHLPFHELIDEDRTHAVELSAEDKREYILPVLEQLKNDYGAKQVFFENAEFEEGDSNRQLYLRIMAEGLLQLIQTLNAQNESVILDVIIAQRQDVDSPESERRIRDDEYIRALQFCINQKKKEHKLCIDENSQLHFEIYPAYREPRLQLADFACNTRMGRDSKNLEAVKERVMLLYEDAYIFKLSEVGSENFIKQSLAEGRLADAVMELYGTKDVTNHKEQLALMLERVKHMNYRLFKSQMKELIAEIKSYTILQDDFKVGERFLKRVRKGFLAFMEEKGYPCMEVKNYLNLRLVDMYLSEGNIVDAREELEACKGMQQKLGNALEEVFSYYKLEKKEALLLIDEFAYQEACDLLQGICHSFEHLMDAVRMDDHLKQRFPNLRSEHYGKTLCMLIYAMMFLQREQPELYPKMCELCDRAFAQYPPYEAELERLRKYRSRIELEQGNYEEALNWLLKAQRWTSFEKTQSNLVRFLQRICLVESETNCQYYMMYYVLIMAEAKAAGCAFADVMWKALTAQEELMHLCGIRKEAERAEKSCLVDMADVQQDNSKIKFHPLEVVQWKYASYLCHSEKYTAAAIYYKKAVETCFADEKCHKMWITGLGIMAEKICCMIKGKDRGIEKEFARLKERIHALDDVELMPRTRAFVEGLRQEAELAEAAEDRQTKLRHLWNAARKISY